MALPGRQFTKRIIRVQPKLSLLQMHHFDILVRAWIRLHELLKAGLKISYFIHVNNEQGAAELLVRLSLSAAIKGSTALLSLISPKVFIQSFLISKTSKSFREGFLPCKTVIKGSTEGSPIATNALVASSAGLVSKLKRSKLVLDSTSF